MNPSPHQLIGIDLGTSNTVAVVRDVSGSRGLLVDGREIMPSAVFLGDTGYTVGQIAVNQAAADPSRFEANPKRQLGRTVVLGDRAVPAAELLTAVFGRVAAEARGGRLGHPAAVLTHPVAWGDDRRQLLAESAGQAGLSVAYLVEEPIAAAAYLMHVMRWPVPPGGVIAVVDLGGGTFDVAAVRNDGGRLTVLGSAGLPDLGGLDIDDAIWTYLGQRVEERSAEVWRALSRPDTYAEARESRIFRAEVRDAKERLSSLADTAVHVPGLQEAVMMSRAELDTLAAPLLARGVAATQQVLDTVGVAPAALTGLFLVGGGARMPLVASLLHRELGVRPAVPPSPERPVAEGALFAPASPPAAATPVPPPQPFPQPPNDSHQPQYASHTPPAASPVPAAPAQPAAALHDARMAHLWGAIGALLGCGMFGWIGPLVYLNGSAKRSAYVRQHAVAALNVQLLGVVGQLVSIVLSFLGIGVVIFVALWIYTIVWGFVAASQAGAGKEAKYPITLQFVH